MAGVVIALLVACVVAWRLRARRRRLKDREGARRLVALAHDERAARASLRPRTGHVQASPVHPPMNGNRQ